MKKLLFILVASVLSFSCFAQSFSYNGLNYEVISKTDKTCAVASNKSFSGDLVIPEKVAYNFSAYSVTSIGREAFRGCSGLKSVTIGNSVTEIGVGAFYECSGLTSVIIGNSVSTIGDYAFEYCSGLTSVTIPNSVTEIGRSAFRDCTSLKELVLEDGSEDLIFGNSEYLGDYFSGCTSLESLYLGRDVIRYYKGSPETSSPFYDSTIVNVEIGPKVTYLGSYIFYECKKLNSVIIGNSVTEIKEAAFRGCSGLTSVTIPESVTSIYRNAFYTGENLNAIYYNAVDCELVDAYDNNEIYYTFSPTKKIVIGSKVKKIPSCLLASHKEITNIEIPNSVTSIGYAAFAYCSGLTNVSIGNSVTSIGEAAFYECSGLTNVSIGNSVTEIGRNAFLYCSGLTSVTIPNSVTEIGENAFYECSGLTNVSIGNSVTEIGKNAFAYCSGLTKVEISDLGAWCNIHFVNSYGNPIYYSHCLYMNGNEITNLIIPDSVTSIRFGVFYGCSGLTSVTIPNSVTSIGKSAFAYCSGLTSVAIPNSVTSIGDYAFEYCSGLTSVAIPNSVTQIGEKAFLYCSGLTKLYLGEKLTSIGKEAFASSQLLEEIVVAALVTPTADKDIFSDFTYTYATLYVPEKTINSYKALSPWSNFFSFKNLEESGVEVIGMDAPAELYDVFNLDGQLVKRRASQSDIDALSPGIYIIGGRKVIVK